MTKKMLLLLGVLALTGVLAGSALATPPQNTSNPTVSGKMMVGQTLTAEPGAWSNNPTSFAYQWQRCSRDGSNCGNIAGQTAKTYKLQDADVGNTVRVVVTAKNADGSTSANSKPSDVISGNAAPRVLTQPSISGTAKVGETLTADAGTWAEGPTFSYQWRSCDKNGAGCNDIAGANGQSYGVRSSDVGNTIRVRVTAKNLVGSADATSSATAVVTSGTSPPVGVGGAISITAVSLPDRLVISQVQFTPRTIASKTQPLTARFKVTEANAGRAVNGALVFAVGIPSNRVTTAGETQTDSTGWATIQFHPLRGLPLRQGARVTFFVRARKAGENPLAGVSTRRLVSVGVHPAG